MSTMAERLAEALLEHQIDLSALRRDRKATAGYWMSCRCGFEWSPNQTQPDQHLTHLAEIQAELVEREIAAARGEVVARVEAIADDYDGLILASINDGEAVVNVKVRADRLVHRLRAALAPDPDCEANQ